MNLASCPRECDLALKHHWWRREVIAVGDRAGRVGDVCTVGTSTRKEEANEEADGKSKS